MFDMLLTELGRILINYQQNALHFGLIIIVVVGVVWFISKGIRRARWPPGPKSNFRMLLHLYYKNKPIHLYLKELKDKYGSIVSIPMLWSRAIYIDDFELVQKLFTLQDQVFSGRPKKDYGGFMNSVELDKSFIINSGPGWKEHKDFLDNFFEKVVAPSEEYEKKIVEEVTRYVDYLRIQRGQCFSPTKYVHMSSANVIFIVTMGKRFDFRDDRFIEIIAKLDKNVELHVESSLLPILCVLRYVPFALRKRRAEYSNNYKYLSEIIQEHVSDHYNHYEAGSKTDMVDAYITERKERNAQNRPWQLFDNSFVVQHVLDMYNAGARMTAASILWIYLYLISRPDSQTRIQKEIDDVVGPNRVPAYADRLKMPYTMAFISEVMRIVSIMAFNMPRKTTQAVEIGEYHIPKDTIIFTNLYSLHRDERNFPNPNLFTPDRFLKDGKFKDSENFIPFSLGERMCIGRLLANLENFLHITCLLQKFTLKNPIGQSLNLERGWRPIGGLHPFSIQAVPRN